MNEPRVVPPVVLMEYVWTAEPGCAACGVGAVKPVDIAAATEGKRIVMFGVPGAFTPTCSEKHLPGYIAKVDEFKKAGIDEIWCLSVNDAYVMGAWAKDQKAVGKVRMVADGSARFTKAMGLALDLEENGFGLRSRRYAMLVDNGVVKALNIEQPGKFEVSDADSMLSAVRTLRSSL
jgi:peroxiredoxin